MCLAGLRQFFDASQIDIGGTSRDAIQMKKLSGFPDFVEAAKAVWEWLLGKSDAEYTVPMASQHAVLLQSLKKTGIAVMEKYHPPASALEGVMAGIWAWEFVAGVHVCRNGDSLIYSNELASRKYDPMQRDRGHLSKKALSPINQF